MSEGKGGYALPTALIVIEAILNIVGRLLTPVIGSFLNFIISPQEDPN